MELTILFSYRVWEKIKMLSSKERSRFLGKVRFLVRRNIPSQQVRIIGENAGFPIFRIRYNLNHRIIATLFKNEQNEKFIKVVDFVSHIEMDRDDYYVEGVGKIEINDIEALDNDLEDISLEIPKPIFGENKFLFENVDVTYFTVQNDDFWCYVINPESQIDPDLVLSSEQFNLIKSGTSLPILLTGSAGSGKTTIAIYLALHHAHLYREEKEYKILYITYNNALVKYSKNIIDRIYPESLENLVTLDYQSLCETTLCRYLMLKHQLPIYSLVLSGLLNEGYSRLLGLLFFNRVQIEVVREVLDFDIFSANKKINLTRFIKDFCQHHNTGDINHLFLWQEIRHLIKGSFKAIENENHILTFEQYQESSGGFLSSETDQRRKVYDLAVQYQNWLTGWEYWDELDLTHYLFRRIPDNFLEKYNEIYCDEIQDLTALPTKE